MDEASIETAGTTGVAPYVSLIDGITSISDAFNVAGQLWIKLGMGNILFSVSGAICARAPVFIMLIVMGSVRPESRLIRNNPTRTFLNSVKAVSTCQPHPIIPQRPTAPLIIRLTYPRWYV